MVEDGPRGAGRILLVGMMGAGKSTVARMLAGLLGWATLDTDGLVERRAAMTVAEMFDEEGEGAFRAAESEAIAELGRAPGPLVASVGGGAVLSEANRAAMRALGTVVWLRARPATLAARVGGGEGRPLLKAGGRPAAEVLEQLVRERDVYYEEVADVVVDVDNTSPEEAVELVRAALSASSPMRAT